jgi:hypothetical protein
MQTINTIVRDTYTICYVILTRNVCEKAYVDCGGAQDPRYVTLIFMFMLLFCKILVYDANKYSVYCHYCMLSNHIRAGIKIETKMYCIFYAYGTELHAKLICKNTKFTQKINFSRCKDF